MLLAHQDNINKAPSSKEPLWWLQYKRGCMYIFTLSIILTSCKFQRYGTIACLSRKKFSACTLVPYQRFVKNKKKENERMECG